MILSQIQQLGCTIQPESLQFTFKGSFDTQCQEKIHQIDQPSYQEESIFDILLKDNLTSAPSVLSMQEQQWMFDIIPRLILDIESRAPLISENFNQSQQKNVKKTATFPNIKTTSNSRSPRESYPTKNLLVNFKKSHFEFLKQRLGKKFTNHRFVQRLMKKKGISMKQYQRIYRTEEFRQSLEQYFSGRVIFRDMMNSKMDVKQKKTFISKLHVFEEAFMSGSFTHIN